MTGFDWQRSAVVFYVVPTHTALTTSARQQMVWGFKAWCSNPQRIANDYEPCLSIQQRNNDSHNQNIKLNGNPCMIYLKRLANIFLYHLN